MKTRHTQSIHVNLPASKLMEICRLALTESNLEVRSLDNYSIVCKEKISLVTLVTWPAEINIVIEERDEEAYVHFNGSIFGFGPIQKRHLIGQIGKLQNRIGVVIDQLGNPGERSPSQSSLSEELSKLAELQASGVLSDQEFQVVKTRLLQSE